ncbi:Serine/threonine-protein kinase ATM [Carex littledalei]|uniref:Serine/threonine-protein kinase ATM n=1 Tax=Carex littledalei TaxID=544730 RepID=A0A833V8W4_9POAL|nr:Serine/threonine-protein kinase ATM [Carex littledalei]
MKNLRREKPLQPDPESLNPTSPSPHRETLDLVWAKTTKGQPWWPARVIANRDGRLHVSRFGEGHVSNYYCHVSQVKPFFNPKIADMARQSLSQAFLSSFKEALRFASQYLQSQLTCRCVPSEVKPLVPGREFEIGTCNFTSPEFIYRIRDAALSVWAVNLEESVRLKSWVFALGRGLCNNGEVGFNQRKLLGDLVDKFDIDLDACADDNKEKSFDECSMGFLMDDNMGLDENLTNSDINRVSKARKKKKRANESDKGLEREFSGTGANLKDEEAGSGKRERKKSKYLSPPYTDVGGLIIHKQLEENPDERSIGEGDDEGVKEGNLVKFEAFSVRDIFNDFLLTGMDPLYLKWKRSAQALRFFIDKYRDNIFVEGREHENYANCKCKCQLKGKVKIEVNLDNGSGLSFKSCLTPKMDRSDLTTGHDVSRIDEELENEKDKVKSDNGAHEPKKKRGRPRKEQKCLSSSASNMPNVEKSEQNKERKDLIDSVSSVPFTANNNISGGTVFNFSKGSYEFLEEARAQMLKTSSVENGNKPQEQGSLKKCKNGNSKNSDSTSGTEPKQRGRKPKVAQAHYPNPAALLLDFSKPNAATVTDTGMGMNLPSRDQLLSTFSKFGLLVEAQSDVHRDVHTARVVFARSADAEAAYNSSDKLGPFGSPFASCRLHYLPPISTNPSSPAQRVSAHQIPAQQLSPKPQLTDIRKNLEIMISSLTGGPGLIKNEESGSALDGIQPEVRGNLVEKMQGLLMKVEKRLGDSGASCSGTVPGILPP